MAVSETLTLPVSLKSPRMMRRSYISTLTANPPEIREQAKQVVRRQIDMAALLGVD